MKRNLAHLFTIIFMGMGFLNLIASDLPQAVQAGYSLADATHDLKFQEENVTGSSRFGKAVANAGDVNGDGFEDLIVGAYVYQVNTGRVYIHFGGSDVDNEADLILSGEAMNNYFGYSVSSAGDVNNDGYSDVIVGAYGYNNNVGRAYIYFGGSSMDNLPDVTLSYPTVDAYFGFAVSGAGDVNGDDYDDVIIGEPRISFNSGKAHIFFGSLDMDSTPDLTISGSEGYESGTSVAGAGDLNGDGFDDVFVGSPGYNSSNGRTDVYFGGATMNNTADVSMIGENSSDRFGAVVVGIGDMNQDGYSDIAASSTVFNSGINDPYSGKIYVYLGAETMDNVVDVSAVGENENDYFGSSIAGNADVNADGFDDFIVGAEGFNSHAGKTYLFYGGAVVNGTADWSVTESEMDSYFGSGAALVQTFSGDSYGDMVFGASHWQNYVGRVSCFYGSASPNTLVNLEIEGEKDGNGFARAIAGVGDVTGDFKNDILFAAPSYLTSTGRVYLYEGDASMSTTPAFIFEGQSTSSFFGCAVSSADFDDNWNLDIAIGAYGYNSSRGRVYIYNGGVSLNTTADMILDGQSASEQFGYVVLADEDLNQDSYGDLIIGAPGYNSNTGRVYVFYGGEPMDNIPDLIFEGLNPGDKFGSSITIADVNMDTYKDIVVGAPESNGSYGTVYLFHGSMTWDTTADWFYTGTQNQERVGSSLGTAIFNQDGFGDILVGAHGYSSNRGRVYLFYGSVLMGSAANLTFEGENTSDYFGRSVSGLGDVNLDGHEDFIIGANGYSNFTGKAYIHFGGENPDNIEDAVFNGESESGSFGYCVSAAQDINGDEIPDIAIGATSQQSSGVGYVYYGSDLMPPAAPVLLQAIAGDALVELTWSSNEETDFYKYFVYADTLENPTILVDSTIANNIADTMTVISGLINGKTYYFRLTAKDQSLNESDYSTSLQATPYDPSGIGETLENPIEFVLSQNYPNPFNPSTTISYALPQQTKVQIVVYDILGTQILQKNLGTQQQGFHKFQLDGTSLSSGIYFYRLTASGKMEYQDTKRMVLIR